MTSETSAARSRRRNFWTLLTLGILTGVGLLAFLLWSGYRDALHSAEVAGRNLAGIIEARLDATLRRTDAVLQALRRDLSEEAMRPDAVERFATRFDAELDARAAHFPELAGLRVFDARGTLLYTSGRVGFKAAAHVDDREFFQALRDDPDLERTYSRVFQVRSTGTTSFGVAYAVRNDRGEFLGIVLALINLDYFQELFDKLDIGPNGIIALRRKDDFTLVLRRPPLPEEINKALVVGNPSRQAVLDGRKESVIRFVSQSDAVVRLFCIRTLDLHPFYVLVALSEDDALAEWRTRALLVAAAGLLLLSAIALAGWRLARSERRSEAMVASLAANEVLLGEAMDMAGMAHWEYDIDSGRIRLNRRFFALLGHAVDSAVDLPAAEYERLYLHPEDIEEVRRRALRCAVEADPAEVGEHQVRFLRGDGEARWMLVRFRYRPAATGQRRRLVGSIMDIHDRRELDRVLRRNEQRFRSLFHEAPVGHALNRLDDGGFVEINIAFAEMTGYGREELSGLSYRDLTPGKYAAEEARQLDILRREGRYGPYEKEYIRKDGTVFAVRLNGTLYEGEDGEKLILSVVEDISERKRAEDELRLMASIYEHSGESILVSDRDNRIVAVNAAFTRLTGYAEEEVLGRNPSMLSSGRTTPEEYQAMWRAIVDSGFWQGEVWDRRKDGSTYPKWLTISVVRDAAGEVTHYIGGFTDISERKAAEDQIRHLAHHDTLTGLPNRFHLRGRLEQALATARRGGGRVAVMFLDLDRFKIINDTLGHHIGDGLLVEVARRLGASVRASDVVARLGGDEFVVVLTEVEEIAAVRQVAEKILVALGARYDIEGNELHSTPSIGIALYPEDGDDVDALMKNADTAMYHAKTAGRNNAQFFTAGMNAEAGERLALENSLRQAIERGEFELHYQPQVDLARGGIVGVEALVRWRHPERGLVPPDKFIPLAEETGLIVPLGEWVLYEAARQMALWRAEGIAGVSVAINLSAHQLRDKALPGVVADVLARHGLEPEDIEIEITESVAMSDPQATIEHLGSLRRMGIELTVDDFGTGYSSLAYLKLLPIHRLKLDRSFVMDIEHDPNDAAICNATIALAHSLGLSVVAEGVETEAQREYLARLGCDLVQGYLYSRPLPAAAAGELLKRGL